MTLLAPFNVNNATISHRFAQFKRKQSHRLATANQVQRDDLTLIDGYDQPTSLQVMTAFGGNRDYLNLVSSPEHNDRSTVLRYGEEDALRALSTQLP